jgi:hypothetical protein
LRIFLGKLRSRKILTRRAPRKGLHPLLKRSIPFGQQLRLVLMMYMSPG